MLWDLTEEVVTEEAEVRERSKFLGKKLGNYFMSQLKTDLAHEELVHKAAKNQAKLQERSVKSMDGVDEGGRNKGGKESDGADTPAKPDKSWSSLIDLKRLEATRSMRVRPFKVPRTISPPYDVMAEMINRVTGQVGSGPLSPHTGIDPAFHSRLVSKAFHPGASSIGTTF